jgi:Nif-specific regulatory protein
VEDVADHERVRRERDLYRELLALGEADEIEPFLGEALEILIRLTTASRGYIELIEDRGDDVGPRFHMAQGCYDEDVEAIRAAISQGIIAEAIATGSTITTDSAQRDPRFLGRSSVRKNRTEAVLCAPIGASPPIGVVYLQDRTAPGPFSEDDRLLVEAFARPLATFAARLLVRRHRREADDPTATARAKIKAEGIIGRSAALARTLEQIALVAPLDIGVLVSGPSGTGKTQLAQVLHQSSPRARRPFVEQSCANLPETLVESELFGAVPGAHSTASRRVEGRLVRAEGGTLFLDEIAELPLVAQAKLLQFLQSKEYYPLGSSRSVRADVRIVAATNADLKERVAEKTFREDLYYRLDVLPVRVPSLSERREDIPLIAAHICERTSISQRLPHLEFSTGARRALETADWPGNVRQLQNRVQEALIRAAGEGARAIERRHLFLDEGPEPTSTEMTLQEATRRFQKQFVERILQETGWKFTEAARRLDISRSHLYNLISAFGLGRKKP